nr:hypothetical protein [Tanacetum cinerariifolium]
MHYAWTMLKESIAYPMKRFLLNWLAWGYEKLSIKLTFYKAFFSSQWKFLIHTILQSMSAKRTSWNEFSSAMASVVICLSTGRKFNFSKYIFESLVRNVDSSSKFNMYPRVGKGCLGVETPLFEGMLVAREPEEQGDAKEHGTDDNAAQGPNTIVSGDDKALDTCADLTRRVEHLEHDKVAQNLEITKLKTMVKKLERANKVKALKLRRLRKVRTSQRVGTSNDTIMDELDKDEGAVLLSEKKKEKKAEEDDEPEVHEEIEVVTIAKLITEVVAAISEAVSDANANIAAAVVPAATITVAPVKVAAASTRRRRGVVIRDPEEESTAEIPDET